MRIQLFAASFDTQSKLRAISVVSNKVNAQPSFHRQNTNRKMRFWLKNEIFFVLKSSLALCFQSFVAAMTKKLKELKC
jgi:hypothetical protein